MADFKRRGSKDKNMKTKDKKVILIINTADSDKTRVGLEIDGRRHFLKEKTKILKAQNTLPLIKKILRRENLNLSDIKAIEVNRGPGSFTGLKVGVAVANALSFILKVPINNKKVGEIEVPKY